MSAQSKRSASGSEGPDRPAQVEATGSKGSSAANSNHPKRGVAPSGVQWSASEHKTAATHFIAAGKVQWLNEQLIDVNDTTKENIKDVVHLLMSELRLTEGQQPNDVAIDTERNTVDKFVDQLGSVLEKGGLGTLPTSSNTAPCDTGTKRDGQTKPADSDTYECENGFSNAVVDCFSLLMGMQCPEDCPMTKKSSTNKTSEGGSTASIGHTHLHKNVWLQREMYVSMAQGKATNELLKGVSGASPQSRADIVLVRRVTINDMERCVPVGVVEVKREDSIGGVAISDSVMACPRDKDAGASLSKLTITHSALRAPATDTVAAKKLTSEKLSKRNFSTALQLVSYATTMVVPLQRWLGYCGTIPMAMLRTIPPPKGGSAASKQNPFTSLRLELTPPVQCFFPWSVRATRFSSLYQIDRSNTAPHDSSRKSATVWSPMEMLLSVFVEGLQNCRDALSASSRRDALSAPSRREAMSPPVLEAFPPLLGPLAGTKLRLTPCPPHYMMTNPAGPCVTFGELLDVTDAEQLKRMLCSKPYCAEPLFGDIANIENGNVIKLIGHQCCLIPSHATSLETESAFVRISSLPCIKVAKDFLSGVLVGVCQVRRPTDSQNCTLIIMKKIQPVDTSELKRNWNTFFTQVVTNCLLPLAKEYIVHFDLRPSCSNLGQLPSNGDAGTESPKINYCLIDLDSLMPFASARRICVNADGRYPKDEALNHPMNFLFAQLLMMALWLEENGKATPKAEDRFKPLWGESSAKYVDELQSLKALCGSVDGKANDGTLKDLVCKSVKKINDGMKLSEDDVMALSHLVFSCTHA